MGKGKEIKKRLTIFISFSPYLFHPANLYEMAVGDTTDAMKRIVIPVSFFLSLDPKKTVNPISSKI